MCGIYCVYKQSRSCQLPFCASPIFHFEIGDFSVYSTFALPSRAITRAARGAHEFRAGVLNQYAGQRVSIIFPG